MTIPKNILTGRKIIEIIKIDEDTFCLKFEKKEVVKKVVKKAVKKTTTKDLRYFKTEVLSENITMEKYSPKSFLVTGDTKKHRGELILMNGKWNRTLQGWIFGLKRISDLENYFDVKMSFDIK